MKTLIALLFIGLLISCESRSGRLTRTPLAPAEKVVIIERNLATYGDNDNYKVKRIDKGVVVFITISKRNPFEKGDTILWRF